MAKIIGIDLGTTYSAVSIWDESRKQTVIIPNLEGHPTTPSVVSVNSAGEIIVGEQAKGNLWEDPDNTVSQIKREMGNDVTVPMKGKRYNPQTISAYILAYLKQAAEHYLSEPVHDAVITVPAYFKEVQKTATRDAGEIAGLNVHQLVNEPTAAAIAYGVSRVEEGSEKTYAVYDLGGGTFDVSIIEVSPQDITVIGTGGDPRLGGLDMDEAVAGWALREIQKKHGVDLSNDDAVKRRIKVEAEGIKKTLVVAENATLNLPFLTVVGGKPLNVKLDIPRAEFGRLIQPLLGRSMKGLEDAIASADEHNNLGGWKALDGILLVGGPTRLREVREMLVARLRAECPDKDPVVLANINPDEAVAMGAAIVAAGLKPIGLPPEKVEGMTAEEVDQKKQEEPGVAEPPALQIVDVTSHSLGIAVAGGGFHKLIEKESPIPCQASDDGFTNVADYTTELLVEVYQGEQNFVAANSKIGQVKIEGLEPLLQGQHRLRIQFVLDVSGTLSTICTDLRTNRIYQGSFAFDTTRMSKKQVEDARRELMAQMAKPGGRIPSDAGPESPPPPEAGTQAIPELTRQQVPAQWYSYWLSARELLSSLQGVQKQRLETAMNTFANAVMASDQRGIEEAGSRLQDAYNEATL
ncbi:MAG TPA: Hsp70 family protein [Ktedonobacterales bacterium]|jgi:molecular chaperone DnaK